MSGGKRSRAGTPQGGVISPLLANVYMHRFLRYWRQCNRGQAFAARIINYADDFVILSRGKANEALAWTVARRGPPRRDGPAEADAQHHQDVRA